MTLITGFRRPSRFEPVFLILYLPLAIMQSASLRGNRLATSRCIQTLPIMPEQTKPIEVTATVIIESRPATVFAYYSNYLNDPAWRAEIKKVEIDTERIRTKTRITEESFLSRRIPKHINRLECIELQPNHRITSQTTSDNPFWSRNTRIVEPTPNNGTKVTYQIEFEAAIVKYGLGFGLPRFIVSVYTKATMKKYLSSLKRILEQ